MADDEERDDQNREGEHQESGDGTFDERARAQWNLIAPFAAEQQQQVLNEWVSTRLGPTLEQLRSEIPTAQSITEVVHQAMDSWAERRRADTDAQLREAAQNAAGEPVDQGSARGGSMVARLLTDESLQERVLDKVLGKVFGTDEAERNPFTLLNRVAMENPDVAAYFASKWAPDPLSHHLDDYLAQAGIKAWDTSSRTTIDALKRAGLLRVPNFAESSPTSGATPSGWPFGASGDGTGNSDVTPPPPDEPSAERRILTEKPRRRVHSIRRAAAMAA